MRNEFFLLRHGKAAKKEEIIYDWPSLSSFPLTEEGKRQIKSIISKLKEKNIDLIYSSDSLRTRQTAEIIAKELGLKINFDPRLRDINLGIYEGRSKEEFRRDFPLTLERFQKKIPKGENWSDVKKRVSETIKDIDRKHKGKNILVVGHGDPLWLLEGILKGQNKEELLDQHKRGNLIKMGELRELRI